MSTFISFSNPHSGDRVTTQALGEEGGQANSTRYHRPGPPPGPPSYGPPSGGNTPTTLALGEEGGGQLNPLLINLLTGQGAPGQGIATDKFNQFHKDADTQKGKVTGDGLLTKSEIEKHLKALKSQQTTLQLFSRFSPQSQGMFSLLSQPLNTQIQVGESMLKHFDVFANATDVYYAFPYIPPTSNSGDSITLNEIKTVAKRDGNAKFIGPKDLNPWKTTASGSSGSTNTTF